jgi:hypothetical protein
MGMTFVIAARKYFGQKDGQTLSEFAKEIGALTQKDREELSEGLAKEFGTEIIVNPA